MTETEEPERAQMKDSVQVVLGAYGGIGSALARRLAERGARLVLAGRDAERLEALAGELDARAVTLDASDFDAVATCLADAREEHGRLDGVACLAGSLVLKPAHLTTADDLDAALTANVRTAFAAVRGAASAMKEGGAVALVSSAAARIGLANHEAIGAAKGAVEGLALAAAATYASRGLRVNAVAPGLVRTPLTERLFASETAKQGSLALHPLGRLGEPDDVAAALEWLLDPAQRWVTGQVLGVDGGLASLKTVRGGR